MTPHVALFSLTPRASIRTVPGLTTERYSSGSWIGYKRRKQANALRPMLPLLPAYFRCDQDVRFGGILYLHDITVCRNNTGASVVTPTTLARPRIARNVLFVTVKWKEPESAEQQRREQLMITNWKDMIDRGSQVARFKSTISPWSIVDSLLGSPVELDVIRQELSTTLTQLTKEPANERKRGGFFSYLFNLGSVMHITVSSSSLKRVFR
jgi:hypothetical protein